MAQSKLAIPELAGIEVRGLTRSSFILRGALAAGAVYGASIVGPFVGSAIAQEQMGDIEILNFALTLEYLEAAFYEMAPNGLDEETRSLVQEFGGHEQAHVDTLTSTITDLGGTPAARPEVSFPNIGNASGFLMLAQTLEDTGVSAYNGAGPQLQSKELLAAAGSIVQLEARHAAVIRMLNEAPPAPNAFDESLERQAVLDAVMPFIQSGG